MLDIDLVTILAEIINFLVLAAALYFLLFKAHRFWILLKRKLRKFSAKLKMRLQNVNNMKLKSCKKNL